MKQITNHTAASRHCEEGTTEAIQKKNPLIWIASFLAMTATLIFTSCEKEIEFNGEQTDPKLVVNSLVEPGKPVKANISKSYFFLDNNAETQAPDDLVATLYVNGDRIGEMTPHYDTVVSYDNWDPNNPNMGRIIKVYTHNYCPIEDDVVKIEATALGFDDVEATTSPLPNAVNCTIIGSQVSNWDSLGSEYEEDSIFRAGYQLEVTLEITDPNPGKTDFFRIRADRGSHYDDDGLNYASYFPEYNDPVFTSLTSIDNEFVDFSDLNLAPQGVFTDMLFDGRSYQLKIPFSVSILKYNDANPDFFRIAFTVEHLSKEYYNYLNTCDQGEVGFQIWAEPIQTYSNVKDGFGIVAGRTVDTLWHDLPLQRP